MYYIDTFWARMMEILPHLAGALFAFLVGWVIAVVAAAVVRQALTWAGIDRWVARAGVSEDYVRAGSESSPSNIVASVVKWLIILASLGIAAEILELSGVSAFIGSLLAYVPNILVAAAILTIGFITARYVSHLIDMGTGVSSLSMGSRKLVSTIVRYAIIVFAVMAALTQLNIVPRLIEIAFAGLVFALALAFGLGGREQASRWIDTMKNKAQTQ